MFATAQERQHPIGIDTKRPATPPDEVATRIGELQQTSFALARDLRVAEAEGDTREAARLAHKLEAIDSAAANISRRSARLIRKDRRLSISTLNAIFDRGVAPAQPLSGDYRGELLTTTVGTPLDALARFIARFYFPWLGKRFDMQTATGDNVFLPSARFVGHLIWPLYFRYNPYRDGHYTAFTFATFTAPGAHDPDLTTLKLDYDNTTNPAFLVQSVLDELVQLTDNYFLGKAYLWRTNTCCLAAFFALRKSWKFGV
jgi:hypothetical protein